MKHQTLERRYDNILKRVDYNINKLSIVGKKALHSLEYRFNKLKTKSCPVCGGSASIMCQYHDTEYKALVE